jgi:hypothetical protein
VVTKGGDFFTLPKDVKVGLGAFFESMPKDTVIVGMQGRTPEWVCLTPKRPNDILSADLTRFRSTWSDLAQWVYGWRVVFRGGGE